jgi:hypothetical protein
MKEQASTELEKLIVDSLRFQRRWQRLSMTAYVLSTTGVLVCTTGGTYAAARNLNELAAGLAAVSTVLIGLEKSLLFREKWKFQLAIATRLSILLSKIHIAGADPKAIASDYTAILQEYANSIPIAGREAAD